jgi:hypothetical protein
MRCDQQTACSSCIQLRLDFPHLSKTRHWRKCKMYLHTEDDHVFFGSIQDYNQSLVKEMVIKGRKNASVVISANCSHRVEQQVIVIIRVKVSFRIALHFSSSKNSCKIQSWVSQFWTHITLRHSLAIIWVSWQVHALSYPRAYHINFY